MKIFRWERVKLLIAGVEALADKDTTTPNLLWPLSLLLQDS